MSHPVTVGGQWFERVHDEEMSPSEGVDETAPIALPQGVKGTGLIQVHEIHQVFHFIQGARVGLRGGGEQKGKILLCLPL